MDIEDLRPGTLYFYGDPFSSAAPAEAVKFTRKLASGECEFELACELELANFAPGLVGALILSREEVAARIFPHR